MALGPTARFILPTPVLVSTPAPEGEPKTDTFWIDTNTGKTWRARVVKQDRQPNLVPNGWSEPPFAAPSDLTINVSVCLVDNATKRPVVNAAGEVSVYEQAGRTMLEAEMIRDTFDLSAEINAMVSERIAVATRKFDGQAAITAAMNKWRTPSGTDPVPPPVPAPVVIVPPPTIAPVPPVPPFEPVVAYRSDARLSDPPRKDQP